MKNNNKVILKTAILISSTLLSYFFIEKSFYYLNTGFDWRWTWTENINYGLAILIPSLTVFTICIIYLLTLLIKGIIPVTKKLIKKYNNSLYYKQKQYKKINKIRTYQKNAAITEDEFNKMKQEILNKIN